MRSLGSMLVETYNSWLDSQGTSSGLDKPIIVLRDQPAFIPPPSAEPLWTSESSYEKTLEHERARSRGRPSSSWSRGTMGTPWFSRSSSSRRRPKISNPSNFRHVHSESFQFPLPEPAQKRFSFRPLELGFESRDEKMSPLLPYFDPADRETQITPPPRAHTAGSSKWEGSSPTLTHDRSYSSMSFHVPRRGQGSVSSQDHVTPPRIPAKARARAYTSPSENIETIVERIASALIEKERLEAEIDSIIERQSIYISSRPSTAYGIPELEPMPSIPALPAAAPSFAERLSTEGRPHTAPSQAAGSGMTSQERTLALAAAAFNSHPFRVEDAPRNARGGGMRDDRSLDRPLAPPLPLVLRPPLRKKKSFSRVSSWLFPGGGDEHQHQHQQRRDMSVSSVTNAPRPVRGDEGFYQCVAAPRMSHDSDVSSLSTWKTTTEEEEDEDREENQTVPTTRGSPGSSPVIQNTPKQTPVVERPARKGRVRVWIGLEHNGEPTRRRQRPTWNLPRLKPRSSGTVAIGSPSSPPWPSSGRAADPSSHKCDTPEHGFQCSPDISHSWGQYSPFFSVPSEIDSSVPKGCDITFAQVLSRHGARDPTLSKSMLYRAQVSRIHDTATDYGPGYEFIKDYKYQLGAEQLTVFGEQHMVNSGIKFYHRYRSLARQSIPFVRASGQDRVVNSAVNWTQGFHEALLADKASKNHPHYPYDMLVIPETPTTNNTLNNKLCAPFTSGEYSKLGAVASETFLETFAPPIVDRLNAHLPGVNFTISDVPAIMDLCPFNTVADRHGALSPFCGLFSADEWASYDYYETLEKWYGFGPGNPLGPTQGVGWVNELLARLTGKPVDDRTCTNATLDDDAATFPLGKSLYADFSHDNDMTSILGALGLYEGELSNSTRTAPREADGYSASWTVPFAARIYVEKMQCSGSKRGEEFVRVLVNDRVVPLKGCDVDKLGRCTLSKFVDSMEFARKGGRWDMCW
ncbi:3-phytase A [Echria macrotheca]|uniref:3-phytase n=1 Tax=Echria macrotheca TaxID=438768 RepID=A0AAJ0B9Z6_9PEZI|nr:3-phytase A [Echria macrotheca]